MASSVCRSVLIRRLSSLSSTSSLRALSSSSLASSPTPPPSCPPNASGTRTPLPTSAPRAFFTTSTSQPPDVGQGPTTIDYGSLLQEDEFHRLADETIHDLQERLEEYGDEVQIDGFDIDYGSQVLTLKLGALGTYVINKQTPNRQIWLSSPVRFVDRAVGHIEVRNGEEDDELTVISAKFFSLQANKSGPSRFDWDRASEVWVYRRTKANLLHLLQHELTQLCGKPISLS